MSKEGVELICEMRTFSVDMRKTKIDKKTGNKKRCVSVGQVKNETFSVLYFSDHVGYVGCVGNYHGACEVPREQSNQQTDQYKIATKTTFSNPCRQLGGIRCIKESQRL